MPPDKGPITKTDLDVISSELRSLRLLMENELRHHAEDISGLRDWRDQFMIEGGPWRTMDKRVTDVEHFAGDAKEVMDRISKLIYGVLTVVLASLILWIVTTWPKLVMLLQGGP